MGIRIDEQDWGFFIFDYQKLELATMTVLLCFVGKIKLVHLSHMYNSESPMNANFDYGSLCHINVAVIYHLVEWKMSVVYLRVHGLVIFH